MFLVAGRLAKGHHRSVAELETTLLAYAVRSNETAKPFRWTKSADEILHDPRGRRAFLLFAPSARMVSPFSTSSPIPSRRWKGEPSPSERASRTGLVLFFRPRSPSITGQALPARERHSDRAAANENYVYCCWFISGESAAYSSDIPLDGSAAGEKAAGVESKVGTSA